MVISDNFNITRLFVDKNIKISIDNKYAFSIKIYTIKETIKNEHWNLCYYLLTNSPESFLPKGIKVENTFDFLHLLFFNLGQFGEFRFLYTTLLEEFEKIFTEGFQLDNVSKQFKINNITITSEIWDYIVYLLKLSYGEKVTKPQSFDSEEARQFFLAQQKYEEKIRRTKQKANDGKNDTDALMKIFLSIVYAFPSITFDYLFDQTMAQIQWLQQYAAGSVSYEVNAQAFAAGNMKKGSKLDFFIK